MRAFETLLIVSALTGAIAPALAADWGALSGTATVTTDYRYRGISGNDRKPALQSELEWNNDSGWHAYAWTSMVDFQDGQSTPIEVDVSAGKKVTLRGTIIDFAVTYYSYPIRSRPTGAPRYSFAEASIVASRNWGDLTLSAQIAWSPNSFGETGMSWYLAAGASYPLSDWLSASANIGRQWVKDIDALHGSGYPYTHWDAGLTASFDKFSLDIRYVDSTLTRKECLLGIGNAKWCEAGAFTALSYKIGG